MPHDVLYKVNTHPSTAASVPDGRPTPVGSAMHAVLFLPCTRYTADKRSSKSFGDITTYTRDVTIHITPEEISALPVP